MQRQQEIFEKYKSRFGYGEEETLTMVSAKGPAKKGGKAQ
jgi:hypothetical protein